MVPRLGPAVPSVSALWREIKALRRNATWAGSRAWRCACERRASLPPDFLPSVVSGGWGGAYVAGSLQFPASEGGGGCVQGSSHLGVKLLVTDQVCPVCKRG